MKFHYQVIRWIPESELTKTGVKFLEAVRPWVDIEVFNPLTDKKSDFLCPCLLDSGSDLTFFTDEIGRYLGYDIEKGTLSYIVGVGGGSVPTYFHKVGIRIFDLERKEKPLEIIDEMGFIKGGFPLSNPQQTGILGSTGFFRWTNTYFSYPNLIQLTSNTNLN